MLAVTAVVAAAGLMVAPAAANAVPANQTTVTVSSATAENGLVVEVSGSGYIDLPLASTGQPPAGVYAAIVDGESANAQIGMRTALAADFKPVVDGVWSMPLAVASTKLTKGAAYDVIVWVAHGNPTDDTVLYRDPVTISDDDWTALFPAESTTPTQPSTSTSIDGTTSSGTSTKTAPTTTATRTSPTTKTSTRTTRPPKTTVPTQTPTKTSTKSSTSPAEKTLTDGTLRWGVKESFRTYVISGPAQGKITTSGGATTDGDQFAFAPATGTVTGSSLNASVPGSVRFSGHDMGSGPLLDLTLSHLAITVTGTSGVLIADVHSTSMQTGELTDLTAVTVATLDLGGHPMTVRGTSVALHDVPAELTEDGAAAFSGFYAAGDDLDPIDFTATLAGVGTSTSVPTSGTNGPEPGTSTPKPTTSTTEASTTEASTTEASAGTTGAATLSAGSVEAGQTVEVRAAGFLPGEKAEIHLHSEPVLLDTVTADAAGAVRARVTIPVDAPSGAHTVVVTGLESGHTASATLTIAAADTPADGPAAVTDGSLSWGVLAAFRSYLAGSIAQGSWQTTGGVTESGGLFTFAVAAGSYDADTDELTASFDGAVRFTGHDMGSGPLLDLTITGLRVQASGDGGSLYADMRSRDMDDPSSWLEASGVRLADLELSGADLAPQNGRITLAGIPATLTAAGADGFAGFYQAGQQLDPVSLTLTVSEPGALGDAGVPDAESGLAATGVPAVVLVALAMALLIAGALALVLAGTRTRTRRAH